MARLLVSQIIHPNPGILDSRVKFEITSRLGCWSLHPHSTFFTPCFAFRSLYYVFPIPIANGCDVGLGDTVYFHFQRDKFRWCSGKILFLNLTTGLGVFRLLGASSEREFPEAGTVFCDKLSASFFHESIWSGLFSGSKTVFQHVSYETCDRFDHKYQRMIPANVEKYPDGSVFFLSFPGKEINHRVLGMMTMVRVREGLWMRCLVSVSHMMAAVRAAADAYSPSDFGGGGHSLVRGETF